MSLEMLIVLLPITCFFFPHILLSGTAGNNYSHHTLS